MELYQLRTFAAVAELGRLTRAAYRLHLSQPAASAQIKALEEEFGVALFERKRNGLVLTRAGIALLPEAQRLLGIAADIAAHAKRLCGEVRGHIRFGAIFDPTLLRLGAFMSRLVARHPMLEIEVRQRNSRAVIAGVASGELDAGMALGARELPGLNTMALARLRYRIVAPGAWADRIKQVGWKDIAALPWISTPKEGSHYQMATELFARYGFEPATVIEADSESIVTSLVIAGVGLGLMREDLAAAAHALGEVVILDKGRAHTLLRFLYVAVRENDPAISALVAVLRELWSGEDGKSAISQTRSGLSTRRVGRRRRAPKR